MKIRLPLKITQLSTLTLLHLCCSGALLAAPADDWGDWALDNERFIVQPGENDLLIERGGDIQALDAQEQAIFQALDNSQLSDYPADASTEMEDDRETFLQQLEDQEKLSGMQALIKAYVEQNWSRPPTTRAGMQALLRISLLPTGEVRDVRIIQSSGNAAFDRSAQQAVHKAGPFRELIDLKPHQRDAFKEFNMVFKPEDI